jgi:hypothetical protein
MCRHNENNPKHFFLTLLIEQPAFSKAEMWTILNLQIVFENVIFETFSK